MKKMILFIAAMLLVGTAAQAADQKLSDQVDRVTKRYRNAKPIVFVESGVTFFVYPNGEIDFKTPRKRNHRVNWNSRNYNAPGSTRGYKYNNRFTVRYDYYGRLNRVGITTIGYNKNNKVRRIGSVLMRYNRRGKLAQVGGLRIYYGKNNIIRHIKGNIHHTGCGYCGVNECNITHDPYYNFNRRSNHYNKGGHDDHYKNRKRKKKYSNQDND
ncbi:hypothetical protein [uncultured Aquimarina sp.]|uniref:hypothetical protein n=1 Tax=uncultured Aquimarina sp. TaxID=575652 RepID=UPI0026317EB5|nr:hypothetical protein [uncultured Aquimarina sp.]